MSHVHPHDHAHEPNHNHAHPDGHNHTHDHAHPDGHNHTHDHAHDHPDSHGHVHHNTKAVKNRLARIGGHLRAVEAMVEDGRDCTEILMQLAAVRSAINGVCRLILHDHMDHCIVAAIERGEHETLDDLYRAIDMLVK